MFVRGFEKTAKIKKRPKREFADSTIRIDSNLRAQRPEELLNRPLEGGHDVYSWI